MSLVLERLPRTKTPQFSEAELEASICRESFYEFCKAFWDVIIPETPVWNWHIRYLCDELQKVAERVFKGEAKKHDLIINVPPGTTKSTICSIMFPAWVWTRMPTARTICASHTHDLVLDLSSKCRMVVESEKYQGCFKIPLRADQNTKGYFATKAGGMRYCCTVSGKSPMGMHAHFLIVDDPIDPKKAISDLEIKAANEFMTRTLPSRKVDKSVTVTLLIMQRLHQSDPAGDWLERSKKLEDGSIRHICLPAEAEEQGKQNVIKPERLRNFYVDNLLDPVRLNKKSLEEYKSLGQYMYSGQFRQDPVPLGGGMFKTQRIIIDTPPVLKEFVRLVRYWDKAATEAGGAYSVGVLMGEDKEERIWVLDVIREQYDSGEREKLILLTAMSDGKRPRIGIEEEPGSGGKESAEGTARRLRGFRVTLVSPKGNKVIRADAYSSAVNSGNVRLKKADWNADYISELRFFPYSTYKDQVDASSGAFTILCKPLMRIGALASRKTA